MIGENDTIDGSLLAQAVDSIDIPLHLSLGP